MASDFVPKFVTKTREVASWGKGKGSAYIRYWYEGQIEKSRVARLAKKKLLEAARAKKATTKKEAPTSAEKKEAAREEAIKAAREAMEKKTAELKKKMVERTKKAETKAAQEEAVSAKVKEASDVIVSEYFDAFEERNLGTPFEWVSTKQGADAVKQAAKEDFGLSNEEAEQVLKAVKSKLKK